MKPGIIHGTRIIRTIIIYVVLASLWTLLAISLDEFTQSDKGLITGIGYLLLLSLSLWLGQGNLKTKKLLLLCGLNAVLFSLSSFILGPLINHLSGQLWMYYIINSIFLSISYVWILNIIYSITYKWLSFALIAFSILIAYWLIEQDFSFFRFELSLSPRLMTFLVFQGLLISALTLSLNIIKSVKNKT